jgi:signal transduction histidine kinase
VKIGIQISLVFFVVVMSLLSVAYVSIWTVRSEMEKSIGESSVTMARQIINMVDRDIYNRIEDFQLYVTRPLWIQFISDSNVEFEKMNDTQKFIDEKDAEWISEQKDNVTPFMSEIIDNWMSQELRKRMQFYEEKYGFNVCGEIFMTNEYGAVIAETGKTSDYRQDDEEWWQAAKREGLYAGNVEYDESSSVYSIPVGVSVKDENGKFLGVMKFVLNMEGSFNVIEEAKYASKYTSIGFKLIEDNGMVVFDSEGNFHPLEDASKEAFFTEITGESGYFVKEAERNESAEVFAYARSNGYKDFDGYNWILFLEYDSEEVFGPISRLQDMLSLVSILGAALAISLALFVRNSISKPLTKLTKATKEISEGMKANIQISSKNEIGDLAKAFVAMESQMNVSRKKLENYTKDLEKSVQDRTQELNSKVSELEENRTAILNMMEDVDQTNKQLTGTQGKLKKSFKELKKLDTEKDQFISIAAHELKTPMTAIHGFAQLLEKENVIKDPENRSKYLKIIEHEVERLARLVTEVLDLSRVDLGTIKFVIDDVDVAQMAEEVHEELKEKARTKGLFLKFNVSRLPKIETDKERVRQILINIVDNSLKYSEKGGTTVTIAREKEFIKFTVADKGIGIPKEHFSKMFTRFYQVENPLTRKVGGTGLGLSICKEFVQALGGKIWFESELGKGTTFYFTIPVVSKVPDANRRQENSYPGGWLQLNRGRHN